jgi:phosphate starvation-inducible membrane PsiE
MMGIFQFSATDFLHNKHLSIYRALQKMNIYFTYFQYICMLTYFYTKWKFQK